MSEPSLYDRLDQARAEIALLLQLISHEPEISLGIQETYGLSLILGRAQEAMGAYLDEQIGKTATT